MLTGVISSKATKWILITSSVVLAARLFWFALRYSVNILYFDQWAFYSPLFFYKNLWQLFTWQHGPHRQGIGLIITKFLADGTGWNSKADSLAIVTLLVIAMVFAFMLKYKLFGIITFWDLIIPLLFLTLFQYEAIVVVPNLSYGAFPVFMIILYCLAILTSKREILRYAILLTLNFLLIYTGWGLFMGMVTILLLLAEFYFSIRNKNNITIVGIVILIAILSQVSFFIDYQFNPAVSCFSFSATYIAQYPIFMGLMLASFFGWHVRILGALATPAGLFLLVVILYILLYHGRQIIKDGLYSRPVSLSIIVLISYGLLFCLVTAVGRVCTGLHLAQVSRYTTLLIPIFLAVYFHLISLKNTRTSSFFLVSFLLISSLGSLPLGIIENVASKTYIAKENWKSCYLQNYEIEGCNQVTGFEIYPYNEQLPDKLEYLKNNRLNLFSDSP